MRTGVPDGRYGMIMSNRALKHVPGTYRAILSTMRVVAP